MINHTNIDIDISAGPLLRIGISSFPGHERGTIRRAVADCVPLEGTAGRQSFLRTGFGTFTFRATPPLISVMGPVMEM